jgi:hypothetical protein
MGLPPANGVNERGKKPNLNPSYAGSLSKYKGSCFEEVPERYIGPVFEIAHSHVEPVPRLHPGSPPALVEKVPGLNGGQ